MSESEKTGIALIVVSVTVLAVLLVFTIWLLVIRRKNPALYTKLTTLPGGRRVKSSAVLSPERKVVVKTRILDINHTVTSKLDTGSAVGRAVVGSFLAGPTGAMVGAMSGHQTVKERHTTTFLLYCEDGSKEAEIVKNDSAKYKKYIALLGD